jgi:hypothetical protein
MVFSFSIAPNLGAQDAPLEVIQAAKLGLPIFLDMFSQQVAELPLFKIEEYGFEESDSLNQAYLGEAFRLYWISRDVILNYQRRRSKGDFDS